MIYKIHIDTGTECEFRLQQWLLNLGIEFHTEAELRERGQARTPDALLKIPIAVKDKQGLYINFMRSFFFLLVRKESMLHIQLDSFCFIHRLYSSRPLDR